MRKIRGTVTALASLVALAVTLVTASGDERPAGTTTDPSNRHADSKAGITSKNVEGLRLAWKVNTKTPVTHRPLVEDDRVYFADWGGTVTAADARSGKAL